MKNFKKIILLFCMSLFSADCIATVDAQTFTELKLTTEFETLLATLLKKYPNNAKLKMFDDAELQQGKCDHPECCQKRLVVNRAAQRIYLEKILEAVQKDPIFLERWSQLQMCIGGGMFLFLGYCFVAVFDEKTWNVNCCLKSIVDFLRKKNKDNRHVLSNLLCLASLFGAFVCLYGVLFNLNVEIGHCRRCYVKKPPIFEFDGWSDFFNSNIPKYDGCSEFFYAKVDNEYYEPSGYIIFYAESSPGKVEIKEYKNNSQGENILREGLRLRTTNTTELIEKK